MPTIEEARRGGRASAYRRWGLKAPRYVKIDRLPEPERSQVVALVVVARARLAQADSTHQAKVAAQAARKAAEEAADYARLAEAAEAAR